MYSQPSPIRLQCVNDTLIVQKHCATVSGQLSGLTSLKAVQRPRFHELYLEQFYKTIVSQR